jgi:hypothetical protein
MYSTWDRFLLHRRIEKNCAFSRIVRCSSCISLQSLVEMRHRRSHLMMMLRTRSSKSDFFLFPSKELAIDVCFRGMAKSQQYLGRFHACCLSEADILLISASHLYSSQHTPQAFSTAKPSPTAIVLEVLTECQRPPVLQSPSSTKHYPPLYTTQRNALE